MNTISWRIFAALLKVIRSEAEELSDGLKMPSKVMDLKRNGIVSDRKHLRRSLLIGLKGTISHILKPRAEKRCQYV
jgi:hypothetical protein